MITYHLGLVFITDQEDTDLRMQQLTGGLPPPEESSDDSMDEDQSEFLQKIGKDLCSKEQFGKPLNTTPFSFISEIGEKPPPKDILLKKLDTYEIHSKSKVLKVKKVNPDVWGQMIAPEIR